MEQSMFKPFSNVQTFFARIREKSPWLEETFEEEKQKASPECRKKPAVQTALRFPRWRD